MSKTVEEVLFDMVGICDQLELDYAVMGGLAVRVHGIPRPTFDVDFQLTILLSCPSSLSWFPNQSSQSRTTQQQRRRKQKIGQR